MKKGLKKNNEKRFEEALRIAEIFRKKINFQLSESKTRILIINGTKEDRTQTWKIGNTMIPITEKITYIWDKQFKGMVD